MVAQRNILNSNWILVLKVFFSTFIWRCLTLAGIKLPTKFCQKQKFGFPLQFAVDIHSINRINTYILDDPWFFKCFFFLSFFSFAKMSPEIFIQAYSWNYVIKFQRKSMPINCFDFQHPLCLAFTTFWPTTGMKTLKMSVLSVCCSPRPTVSY